MSKRLWIQWIKLTVADRWTQKLFRTFLCHQITWQVGLESLFQIQILDQLKTRCCSKAWVAHQISQVWSSQAELKINIALTSANQDNTKPNPYKCAKVAMKMLVQQPQATTKQKIASNQPNKMHLNMKNKPNEWGKIRNSSFKSSRTRQRKMHKGVLSKKH